MLMAKDTRVQACNLVIEVEYVSGGTAEKTWSIVINVSKFEKPPSLTRDQRLFPIARLAMARIPAQ